MRKMVVAPLIALLGGFVAVPGLALAHAAYKSSQPAHRSRVASPPARVNAEFTEPLADGSVLQVTDPCGDRVDAGDVDIVGYEMEVSMSGSRSGSYTVFYRAFSQLDPHVVEGTFTFTAASGPSCPSTDEDPGSSREPKERTNSFEPGDESRSDRTKLTLAEGPSGGSGGSARPGSERSTRIRASSRPPGREPIAARVPNIAAPEPRRVSEDASVYDGIPIRPFVAGLLLAALIGAAGGKIYAGIMGPRA